MASIPQLYSNDSFSSADFFKFQYPVAVAAAVSGTVSSYSEYTGTVSSGTIAGGGCGDGVAVSSDTCPIWATDGVAVSSDICPIWATDENFPIISYDNVLALDQSDVVSPSQTMMPFPADQLGTWDSAVPTLAEHMAMYGTNEIQNFGARFQPPSDVCECGDACCAFMHDLKPKYAAATTTENWGIQNNQMPSMEGANVTKVGRYSVEERKDRIRRYLKKKNRRNFNKTIKYACRKTLADQRVRVRGRFARNNELCEEEMVMMKNKEKNLYCVDDVQIKQDEEWLQEAIASLMFSPYIAG